MRPRDKDIDETDREREMREMERNSQRLILKLT